MALLISIGLANTPGGGQLAEVMGLHVATVMYKREGKPSPRSAVHVCCCIRVFYGETEAMGYMCAFHREVYGKEWTRVEWKLGSSDPGGPMASIRVWRQDQCPAGLAWQVQESKALPVVASAELIPCTACKGLTWEYNVLKCGSRVGVAHLVGCLFVGTSILASLPIEIRLPRDPSSHGAL